ncbi:hypothetical protein AB1N83_012081 [Pleurotus pulmonarius]
MDTRVDGGDGVVASSKSSSCWRTSLHFACIGALLSGLLMPFSVPTSEAQRSSLGCVHFSCPFTIGGHGRSHDGAPVYTSIVCHSTAVLNPLRYPCHPIAMLCLGVQRYYRDTHGRRWKKRPSLQMSSISVLGLCKRR